MFEHTLVEPGQVEPEAYRFAGGDGRANPSGCRNPSPPGSADLTLLGNAEEIRQKANFLGLSLKGAAFLDRADPGRRKEYARTYYELPQAQWNFRSRWPLILLADVAYFGTLMVHRGRPRRGRDGLVLGGTA